MPFIKQVAIFAKKVVASVVLPKVDAGNTHTIVVDTTGKSFGWGGNTVGQIGDNSITLRGTPVSVLGAAKTFCKISSGNQYTLAIDKNGRAWGWGSNNLGQIGDNSSSSKRTPVSVRGAIKTFCQISGGAQHTLAIDKNGRAWAWGFNFAGQLGDNSSTQRNTPVSVLGAIKTFCKISGAGASSFAIDKNGRAWAWGDNGSGQLGDNSITSRRTPVSVAGAVKTFCEITGGGSHTVAVDKDGRVWAWGDTSSNQLGNNTSLSKCTPVSVLGAAKTFCKIESNGSHTIVIDRNGRIWSWGGNGIFQLGDNTNIAKKTPVSVAGAVKTFCEISTGASHTLAIDKNGRAWAWGSNGYGAVGDNNFSTRATPVSVLGTTKTFCKIAGGTDHSVAIDKNGRLWSWGRNIEGQLGDNTTVSKRTPVSVLGAAKTFCKISAAAFHSVAIDRYSQVWSWGSNSSGQLGNNSTTDALTPVSILGVTKVFCEITSGDRYSAGIDNLGRVWSWGLNDNGQLGDNSTTNQCTPVAILGTTKTFCKISAGQCHTVAIDKNGRVWAWGRNSVGQLGDNSVTQRNTPVSVAGAVKTFCQIAAGNVHTIAIDKNGRSWAWGNNTNLELGINEGGTILTPVRVCNL